MLNSIETQTILINEIESRSLTGNDSYSKYLGEIMQVVTRLMEYVHSFVCGLTDNAFSRHQLTWRHAYAVQGSLIRQEGNVQLSDICLND